MRVIISGPVDQQHLDDAELIAGITATSFVTNGLSSSPASDRPTEVYPICPKQPAATAELARDYTLAHNADALICVGQNDHLVNLCRSYDMPVYEAED